jgi:hypothetical protein
MHSSCVGVVDGQTQNSQPFGAHQFTTTQHGPSASGAVHAMVAPGGPLGPPHPTYASFDVGVTGACLPVMGTHPIVLAHSDSGSPAQSGAKMQTSRPSIGTAAHSGEGQPSDGHGVHPALGCWHAPAAGFQEHPASAQSPMASPSQLFAVFGVSSERLVQESSTPIRAMRTQDCVGIVCIKVPQVTSSTPSSRRLTRMHTVSVTRQSFDPYRAPGALAAPFVHFRRPTLD